MKITGIQTIAEDGCMNWSIEEISEVTKFMQKNSGKKFRWVFDTDINNRSAAQNAFFHAVIVPAMQRAMRISGLSYWEDASYVKEVILKKSLLTVNHDKPNEYIRSTSSLNVYEMLQFICNCIKIIINFGGELEYKDQSEFQNLIKDFKLESAVDELLK